MATGHNPLGSRAYSSGSTPTPDLGRQAAKAFANPPPAIVQPAKRDWKYYEGAIIASEEITGKLLREYKEGGTWKDQYKTWGAACVPFDLSRRRANELILQDVKEEKAHASGSPPVSPNKQDKKEEAALKKVESARQEQPEKPRVKTADEVIAENGHVEPVKPQARTENGRPKNQLAIWKEIEESLLGRALNRTDELNRQCPNGRCHVMVLSGIKSSMRALQEWKDTVK